MCASNTIKNFEGDWNEMCVSCTPGTGTRAEDVHFTTCYFMYTCLQWKEWNGASANRSGVMLDTLGCSAFVLGHNVALHVYVLVVEWRVEAHC